MKFLEMMDDDFNTAGAIGVLHELAGEINALHRVATDIEKNKQPEVLGRRRPPAADASATSATSWASSASSAAAADADAKQRGCVDDLMKLLIAAPQGRPRGQELRPRRRASATA